MKKEYWMMGNWKVLVMISKVDIHYRVVQTFSVQTLIIP